MDPKDKISPVTRKDPETAEPGFYDPDPPDEEELWFLPDPDQRLHDAHVAPLPQADQTPLIDVAAWRAAEAGMAAPLADLALQFGMLAERLRQGPEGWGHRLALMEAADLSWLAGDRVPAERLALWQVLRLPGDGDDMQALMRAGWAARRLTDGAMGDLAGFLGRHDPAEHDQRLADKIADWDEVMGAAAGLHPISRAALGFHIWPVLGLSAGPSLGEHGLGGAAPLPLMEAAVAAAVTGGAGSAPFLPLALGGALGLQATGTPEDRLRRWITGAGQGVRAARRHLDQLDIWEAKARDACAGLSGRTPPQLITALLDHPLISAPMAQKKTGASRAAIQRNLNTMVELGVAREVTGQGRYRFWKAKV